MGNKNEEKYKCTRCDKHFKYQTSYKKHMDKHDGKRYKCDQCEKSYTAQYSLVVHKRSHTGARPYACSKCGARFSDSSHRLRHEKSHCDRKSNNFKIDQMNGLDESSKPFSQVSNKGKTPSSQSEMVIICKLCGSILKNMNSFRIHKYKHMGKRYNCLLCGKSYTAMSSLKQHEQLHTLERPFSCTKCNARFRSKNNLVRHKKMHEGNKDYICHVCGKAFCVGELLKCHLKTHDDTLRFNCDICGNAFKSVNSLKNHRKIHTNQREFKCEICFRTFIQKITYNCHMRTHMKADTQKKALFIQPTEFCHLCPKVFANKYGLKRHLLKHEQGKLKKYNKSFPRHINGSSLANDVENTGSQTNCESTELLKSYSNMSDYRYLSAMIGDNKAGNDELVGTKINRVKVKLEIDDWENCYEKLTVSNNEIESDTDTVDYFDSVKTFKPADVMIRADICKAAEVCSYGDGYFPVKAVDMLDKCEDKTPPDLNTKSVNGNENIVTDIDQLSNENCITRLDTENFFRSVTHDSNTCKRNDYNTKVVSKVSEIQDVDSRECTKKYPSKGKVVQDDGSKVLTPALFSNELEWEKIPSAIKTTVQAIAKHNRIRGHHKSQSKKKSSQARTKMEVVSNQNRKGDYHESEQKGRSSQIHCDSNQCMALSDFCLAASDIKPVQMQHTDTMFISTVLHKEMIEKCDDISDGLTKCLKKNLVCDSLLGNRPLKKNGLQHETDRDRNSVGGMELIKSKNACEQLVKEERISKKSSIKVHESNHTEGLCEIVNEGAERLVESVNGKLMMTTKDNKNFSVDCSKDGDNEVSANNSSVITTTKMKNQKYKKTYECGICPKSFFTKTTLQRHKSIHKSETCEQCHKQFSRRYQLNMHIKMKTCKRKFKCKECGVEFQFLGILQQHLKQVHNQKPFQCDLCEKKFLSSSSLNRHKVFHVDGTSDLVIVRKYMCSECGKTYTAKYSLKIHMMTHTKKRQFVCHHCQKSYLQKAHLRRHIQSTHLMIRNVPCEFPGCTKCFYDRQQYKKHFQSHTGEKPFQCIQCLKYFATKVVLNTHTKTLHTHKRDFICQICHQEFTVKNSLLRHQKRHEAEQKMNPESDLYDPNYNIKRRQKFVKKMAEKQFECENCEKKFTTKRGLLAHYRQRCKSVKHETQTSN